MKNFLLVVAAMLTCIVMSAQNKIISNIKNGDSVKFENVIGGSNVSLFFGTYNGNILAGLRLDDDDELRPLRCKIYMNEVIVLFVLVDVDFTTPFAYATINGERLRLSLASRDEDSFIELLHAETHKNGTEKN